MRFSHRPQAKSGTCASSSLCEVCICCAWVVVTLVTGWLAIHAQSPSLPPERVEGYAIAPGMARVRFCGQFDGVFRYQRGFLLLDAGGAKYLVRPAPDKLQLVKTREADLPAGDLLAAAAPLVNASFCAYSLDHNFHLFWVLFWPAGVSDVLDFAWAARDNQSWVGVFFLESRRKNYAQPGLLRYANVAGDRSVKFDLFAPGYFAQVGGKPIGQEQAE